MGEVRVYPSHTYNTMKTFAALLLVAAVVSATEYDALSTFQAADWSTESTEAPGFTQEATDAPTMTLMDAVEELKLKAPAALKEHVVRVAKHASLIQSTNLDARAKAYKHSFNKSKAALHSALNMLVSQLKAGHKHDTGVLKQTKRSLEKGMSSVLAAAKNKATSAKHKACPLQRAEEKARSKRSGAKKAMLRVGNAKVCPLSATMEDMDVDKNTPAFGVELRNKWDRVRAKYVKHNAAHNAAVKAHEAAKSKVAAAYAAMKTAVKLEASNSHSRCKQAKAEYEVLKKDVFSNVKTRKSVATSVLVVKCYVNHITNNNAAHHCANRARRQSQAIWNIRAPAWKPCTSVASLQSQFGPVNWTASYRNCAGHRKEVKSKERAKKEKAKKAAKKEKAAKAKVREIKAKEAKAAKKEAHRVKELKAKAAAAKERSNKAKAAEKKTKAVKAHKERVGKNKLTCHTASRHSNNAGVITTGGHRGYTMTGGGMNNHYRSWDAKSAFEEAFPHGNNYRCDTGFGPGRLTCYNTGCKVNKGAFHCTTRSVKFTGSGVRTATLPRGYTMTGGGLYNHYRHFNARAGFEESFPSGNGWRGDMGFGWGSYTVYVRGCKATGGHGSLKCVTAKSAKAANYHYATCPGGYMQTGCGMNNHYRSWNKLSAFEQVMPASKWGGVQRCLCDTGFGPGKNTCYARCCKIA